LNRLADLLERDMDEFAALEALNVGKAIVIDLAIIAA
jgi:acyl-CoA reductase-like NAD-dependent aldehyde dehydrogenase